ncbi:MAG: uroporphyrinogen decarboxylase family protein, partial [Christensenellales bacterium]
MKNIVKKMLENRHLSMPILSFPSTSLIGCSVAELVSDAGKQALGMKAVADRCPTSASLNMMELSVEAEAFGAQIRFSPDEIPTIRQGVLSDLNEAANLDVPKVGGKRTGIFIEGIKKAKALIKDRPVFCGVIGPYSLAGRLYDMTMLMMACYDEPDNVKILLEKCASFISDYIAAFKKAGADGVIIAEPAAGLLSPALCEEFSSVYVKRIIESAQDNNFVFVYHNCGNTLPLIDSLAGVGADIYHFGNAVDMQKVLELMPRDKVAIGNINPVDFRTKRPAEIYKNTTELLNRCAKYPNYIISSGCDIPADS